MKDWTLNSDGTVTLVYEDGESVLVSKKDFNRAFGAMVNASKEDVKRDFGITQ